MNLITRLFACLVVVFYALSSFKSSAVSERLTLDTQQSDTAKRWEKYIDLNTYMQPFWLADTITDETVQLINSDGQLTAPLLFKAKKILSVKAANHSKIFVKGSDWNFKKGNLSFGPNSTIPFFLQSELLLTKPKPGYTLDGKVPGTYVLFHEGTFFTEKQIEVTYIKDKVATWKGPVSHFNPASLPNTIGKLQGAQNLKIVFYGNSIEVGHNASGVENAPPFMPAWPELLVHKLKTVYKGNIDFANTSVSGRFAKWGLDSVAERVLAQKPDLVIIGFGMNDGTFKVAPDVYREQIKGIMDAVKKQNEQAEFILIAPMLANPVSGFDQLQPLYKSELNKLETTGGVVADMTGVHQELLKHKSYQDMTGNNINHPNDYLARWYAQLVCGLLVK